jgi:hypothetical protein
MTSCLSQPCGHQTATTASQSYAKCYWPGNAEANLRHQLHYLSPHSRNVEAHPELGIGGCARQPGQAVLRLVTNVNGGAI